MVKKFSDVSIQLNFSKTNQLNGSFRLPRSKSLANRMLFIRAVSGYDLSSQNWGTSKDTRILLEALESTESLINVGAAGTSFRFMTAYLAATTKKAVVLTGSERMQKRPIGVLVDALREIGAQIEYFNESGFPPLKITPPSAHFGKTNSVRMPSNVSSQFITAMLMLGPNLPKGISLELVGKVVSRPYIQLTLNTMNAYGAKVEWQKNTINVLPSSYTNEKIEVEADWSAASYFYSFAAIAQSADIKLIGLHQNSWQGDSVLPKIYTAFGVKTEFTDTGIKLTKAKGTPIPPFFEYDFSDCPDLAQTLMGTCAALGVHGLFTGLETLPIKETDRIQAMQTELSKANVWLTKLPTKFSSTSGKVYYQQEGKANWEGLLTIETYKDHRMAMAFAPLALLGEIQILDPLVVEKSYPHFWKDVEGV